MTSTPCRHELLTLGAQVSLRNGSYVRVRQSDSSDRELLLRAFEHLGTESRYRRFLSSSPTLSERMLRYLTDIDHHRHEAFIAVDERSGEGVGFVRYVRDTERPTRAEVALTVLDGWQGQGLGTLLLELICARAEQEGIATLSGVILATNREILEVISSLGPMRIVRQEAGTTEIELPIPEVSLPPTLTELLCVAARDESCRSHKASADARKHP